MLLSGCTLLLAVQQLGAHEPARTDDGRERDRVVIQQEIEKVRQTSGSEQVDGFKRIRRKMDGTGYAKDSVYAKLLLRLGYAWYVTGQADSAQVVLQEATRMNRQRRSDIDPAELVQTLFYLGTVQQHTSNFVAAAQSYRECIEQGANYAMHYRAVGYAHSSLSLIYYAAGEYQEALNAAEQGIGYARRLADKTLEGRCLSEAARNLLELERLEEGKRYVQQAITLVHDDPMQVDHLAFFRFIQAQIFYRNREYTRALINYRRLLLFYKQRQQPEKIADVYGYMGELYETKLTDYLKALEYYRLAHRYAVNSYEKARMMDSIANILLNIDQWDQALASFQEAICTLPIHFSVNDPRRNPPATAIQIVPYKEYLLSILQHKAGAWLEYAKAEKNNPQYLRRALDTYQVADQMIDYMRWGHKAQASKLTWRERTRSMYERAIETCYRLGDAEQAFRFFEKSRAVMLADKLNELGARQQLPNNKVIQEKALRLAVSTAQSELANKTPKDADYNQAQAKLPIQQNKLDAFIKKLETSNPTYFQRKYDTTTTRLADLQRYLRDRKAAFVSYFVGDSAVYVLTVEGNRSRLQRLPQSVPTFRRNIQTLMARLVNSNALTTQADLSQYLQSANDVYRQALAPLGLPAGRVIVSPDRFFVPFEALSYSASKPDYLVEKYAFDYAYSARLLLRKPDQPFEWRSLWDDGFLGFAPVRFAPRLGQVSLPGSDQALEAIGGRFRGANLFVGERANRRAFEQQAADARVIQLFTHAVADSTEREPLLYFADDTLRLSDLSNGEPLRAQLAVLGACQTGVGADQVGEGVFSLARGFAALGVPSIVSTLWSVQDQATYDLTESFHQYLDEGLPKDVALQHAKQNWLRNHHGADQSPNVWAGLILLGDAEPLSRSLHWSWLAAGIVLIVGGGRLWSWRRRVKRDRLILLRLA